MNTFTSIIAQNNADKKNPKFQIALLNAQYERISNFRSRALEIKRNIPLKVDKINPKQELFSEVSALLEIILSKDTDPNDLSTRSELVEEALSTLLMKGSINELSSHEFTSFIEKVDQSFGTPIEKKLIRPFLRLVDKGRHHIEPLPSLITLKDTLSVHSTSNTAGRKFEYRYYFERLNSIWAEIESEKISYQNIWTTKPDWYLKSIEETKDLYGESSFSFWDPALPIQVHLFDTLRLAIIHTWEYSELNNALLNSYHQYVSRESLTDENDELELEYIDKEAPSSYLISSKLHYEELVSNLYYLLGRAAGDKSPLLQNYITSDTFISLLLLEDIWLSIPIDKDERKKIFTIIAEIMKWEVDVDLIDAIPEYQYPAIESYTESYTDDLSEYNFDIIPEILESSLEKSQINDDLPTISGSNTNSNLVIEDIAQKVNHHETALSLIELIKIPFTEGVLDYIASAIEAAGSEEYILSSVINLEEILGSLNTRIFLSYNPEYFLYSSLEHSAWQNTIRRKLDRLCTVFEPLVHATKVEFQESVPLENDNSWLKSATKQLITSIIANNIELISPFETELSKEKSLTYRNCAQQAVKAIIDNSMEFYTTLSPRHAPHRWSTTEGIQNILKELSVNNDDINQDQDLVKNAKDILEERVVELSSVLQEEGFRLDEKQRRLAAAVLLRGFRSNAGDVNQLPEGAIMKFTPSQYVIAASGKIKSVLDELKRIGVIEEGKSSEMYSIERSKPKKSLQLLAKINTTNKI